MKSYKVFVNHRATMDQMKQWIRHVYYFMQLMKKLQRRKGGVKTEKLRMKKGDSAIF